MCHSKLWDYLRDFSSWSSLNLFLVMLLMLKCSIKIFQELKIIFLPISFFRFMTAISAILWLSCAEEMTEDASTVPFLSLAWCVRVRTEKFTSAVEDDEGLSDKKEKKKKKTSFDFFVHFYLNFNFFICFSNFNTSFLLRASSSEYRQDHYWILRLLIVKPQEN